MRILSRTAALVLAAALATTGAMAEPMSGKAAKKQLFSARGFKVEIVADSGLDEVQRGYIELLAKDPSFNGAAKYYGAMAISPAFFDIIISGGGAEAAMALVAFVDNFHSPAAADAAALAACDQGRTDTDAPCVVAARTLPKKWQPRDLSLSVNATAALKAYRKGRGSKAFAVSVTSQAYAVAKGDDAVAAALQACNRDAAQITAADCLVVIAD